MKDSWAAFHSTYRHALANFPKHVILKCVPLREVVEGSLYGQTLDPSILTKGESLLHVHTSGAVARRDTAPTGKEQ